MFTICALLIAIKYHADELPYPLLGFLDIILIGYILYYWAQRGC